MALPYTIMMEKLLTDLANMLKKPALVIIELAKRHHKTPIAGFMKITCLT